MNKNGYDIKKIILFLSFIIVYMFGIGRVGWAEEIDARNLNEIRQHEGEFTTVVGLVESTHIAKSGKVRFLNLGKDYREAFTVVIFTGDLSKFTSTIGEPTDYYMNKKIKVKGRIKIYKGKPEIIASSPEQITIIK